MNTPTLADEFLIADLPDNVKEAIARVYGLRGEFTREDLEAAYEAGFEEGTESVEAELHSYGSPDFKGYMKYAHGR